MSAGNKINLLPGDYVFREGEFGQTAYIIETGTMELTKYTGDEHTVLTELEKGALFGEMAIIDNSARSASARAKTECVLKVDTSFPSSITEPKVGLSRPCNKCPIELAVSVLSCE